MCLNKCFFFNNNTIIFISLFRSFHLRAVIDRVCRSLCTTFRINTLPRTICDYFHIIIIIIQYAIYIYIYTIYMYYIIAFTHESYKGRKPQYNFIISYVSLCTLHFLRIAHKQSLSVLNSL